MTSRVLVSSTELQGSTNGDSMSKKSLEKRIQKLEHAIDRILKLLNNIQSLEELLNIEAKLAVQNELEKRALKEYIV